MTAGRPLRWLAPPDCRPAHSLPACSPADLWAETRDLIREREREHAREREGWARAIVTLMALHEQDLADAQAGHAASLEALSHASALAQDGAAEEALGRLMGAVVAVEARARKGDPAGAALALCRWLEKMRGTGTAARAMVGANETARDVVASGPGREETSTWTR